MSLLWIVLLAGFVLLALLAVGILVLVKLGVIAGYALRHRLKGACTASIRAASQATNSCSH